MQHQSPPQLGRDREREARDRESLERQRHQDELIQYDREREMFERQQREQQQHQPIQNHAGSIPIHQPVASKVPNTIHGPNGLLSNLGAGSSSTPSGSNIGMPNSLGNMFSAPVHQTEGTPRSFLQTGQQMLGFGAGPTPNQGGGGPVGQGQQPILNVSGRIFYTICDVFHTLCIISRLRGPASPWLAV